MEKQFNHLEQYTRYEETFAKFPTDQNTQDQREAEKCLSLSQHLKMSTTPRY